jgi:hypothetical protein
MFTIAWIQFFFFCLFAATAALMRPVLSLVEGFDNNQTQENAYT